ncbi:glycoside hydrolase family 3 N-terminal domain-containing protein [Candidatus Latescibacterota bacterium]
MRLIYKINLFLVLLLAMSAVFFSGCEREITEKEDNWIEETLASMDDNQKIGQFLSLSIDPIQYFLYPNYKRSINSLVRKYQPGSVFFSTNLDTLKLEIRNEFNGFKLREEILEIQTISEIPLLVGAHLESGAWYWDLQATRFPFPLALGAARSAEMAYRQGKITAVEAKTQGINLLVSPVMNTSIDQNNIALQIKSFGNDAEIAKELGVHFVRGCQEVDIAACMKYFPNEKNNSLLTLSPDEIDSDQKALFKAVIDAGVMSVMGSPVNLTGNLNVLSTDSQQMTAGLLRKQFGFDGLFICNLISHNDSNDLPEKLKIVLEMIKNGANMFIVPETLEQTLPLFDLLLSETFDGKVDINQIDNTVRKILEMKKALHLDLEQTGSSLRALTSIGLPEYHQTSLEISDASITVNKNENNIIPVDYENEYVVSIAFLDEFSPYYASLYGENLERIDDSILGVNIFGIPDTRIQHEAVRRATEADVVICSFFIKPEKGVTGSELSPEIHDLIRRIIDVNQKSILVSFYNPHLIQEFPDVKGSVIAYSPSQNSMDSALKVLFK